MTYDKWFESKYPKHVYGDDGEIAAIREEYREVWDAALAAHSQQHIKDVQVPLAVVLDTACAGCGKKPTDFIS